MTERFFWVGKLGFFFVAVPRGYCPVIPVTQFCELKYNPLWKFVSFGDFLEVFFWSRDFVWFCYSHVISLNFHARPFIYRFYVIYARKASLKPCARKKIRNSGNLQGLFVVRIGLSLHIFGKCTISEGCNSPYFSTRCENLVRKHNPQAWELARIRLCRLRQRGTF